ncbi:MAG TPA: protein-methionine-sulfoxide reductase heme-binding subunit MsrQ [Myxococcaceae bacterium]|nr:protein-methionine-sulfoxide reductase heme-binding subunit MsrQ [Myxococcaceae bacterium]
MAKPLPGLKPGLIVGGLVPGVAILVLAARGALAADPIAEALNRFGLLALVFLVASLACTPLKAIFGWTWPIRVRRTLGLFSFGYACAHFLTYAWVDQQLNLGAIVEDIAERKFILVGFLAFVLLIPLAVTSTKGWVRRLGFARWQRVHRLVYAAVLLALLHFVWRVKIDVTEPAIYAAIVALLFAVRLFTAARKRVANGPGARRHQVPSSSAPASLPRSDPQR